MQKGTVKVVNPTGFHLRPAGKLSEEAQKFDSTSITFVKDSKTANAKSLLAVLGAGVKCGDVIEFCCEGPDEEKALETMINVVTNDLGE